MLAFNQYVQPKRALALLLDTAFTAPEDWASQWTDYNATPKPVGSKRPVTAIKVSSFPLSVSTLLVKVSISNMLVSNVGRSVEGRSTARLPEGAAPEASQRVPGRPGTERLHRRARGDHGAVHGRDQEVAPVQGLQRRRKDGRQETDGRCRIEALGPRC